MVTNTNDLNLRTVQTDVLRAVRSRSAFAQAMTPREIPVGETVVNFTVNAPQPQWVREGERKPAASGGTTLEVKPEKQAYIHILTEEVDDKIGSLAQAIEETIPAYYGALFDSTLAGHTAAPSSLFHTLASAPTEEVAGYSELNTVLGELPRGANAFVLSERFYRKVTGLLTTNGVPLIDPSSGSLLGLPVYRYNSTAVEGFVGDFSGSAFAGMNLSPNAKFSDAATLVDQEGTTHHLWQEDKVAYLFEAWFASGIRGASTNFRKLEWAEDNGEDNGDDE